MMGFFKEMLSEQGYNGSHISSKRVIGLLFAIVSIVCTIYLTIKEGGTIIVENLIQTMLVMSASLLGISSVTSIWKHGSISMSNQNESTDEKHKPVEQKFKCPYIEKGTD